MIYIDLPADLNAEDDTGRNTALLRDAVDASAVTAGTVLVAGTPTFWSWVVVDTIERGVVYLHQISAQEAAGRGPLIVPIPTSA